MWDGSIRGRLINDGRLLLLRGFARIAHMRERADQAENHNAGATLGKSAAPAVGLFQSARAYLVSLRSGSKVMLLRPMSTPAIRPELAPW